MKKLNKKHILSKVVLLILFWLAISCTTHKQLTTIAASEQALNKAKKLEIKLPIVFSYKGKIDFDKKSHRISGKVKILNQDEIFIQVVSKALGIELFKIYMNHDSIIYVNKYEKKYYSGIISGVFNGDFIDANYMARALTGRYTESAEKSTITYYKDLYNIRSVIGANYQQIRLNSKGIVVENIIHFNEVNLALLLNGSIKHDLPASINVSISSKKLIFSGNIDIFDVQKLKETSIRFEIPDNYITYR